MRIISLLLALAFSLNAFASYTPSSIKGQEDSSASIITNTQAPNKQATGVAPKTYLLELENDNLLSNPGFEATTYSSGWTLGGTGTHSTEVSELMFGKKAARVDTVAQTLSIIQDSALYASVFATARPQGYVRAWIYNTAPNATICARSAGVTLSGNNCITLSVLAGYKSYEIPVVLGGTSNGLEVSATSTTGITIVDRTYVGVGAPMPEVAQAQFLGSIKFGTDCTSSASTGTFTDFTDVACTKTISGSLLAASANRIGASLPVGSPAGKYVFQFVFPAGFNATAINQTGFFSLNYNGTRFSDILYRQLTANDSYDGLTLIGEVTETSALTSAKDVYLQGRIGTASDVAFNLFGDSEGYLIVTYYPPASKIYSQTCNDPRKCENVFSATLDSAGTVSGENLDFINGNAASGGTGIKTVTWNTGIFTADPNCVLTVVGGSSASNELHIEISASSSTSLTYETASTGADSNFAAKLVCQKQGVDYTAQNQITGTFANVVTAPGISKPKTCYYKFGGASATLAAPTECTTGPCTEVVDTCGTGTPPAFGATGNYTSLTFASGTWASSVPIDCRCTAYDTTTDTNRACFPTFITAQNSWSSNSSGGYVTKIVVTTGAGAAADGYVSVSCTGQAP